MPDRIAACSTPGHPPVLPGLALTAAGMSLELGREISAAQCAIPIQGPGHLMYKATSRHPLLPRRLFVLHTSKSPSPDRPPGLQEPSSFGRLTVSGQSTYTLTSPPARFNHTTRKSILVFDAYHHVGQRRILQVPVQALLYLQLPQLGVLQRPRLRHVPGQYSLCHYS